jgi:VIT1/CCC1 family predicted Fe2+/Mn2+ transporter
MFNSLIKGISFGITSAVITTLGIIVGIHAGTDLKHGVIVAILVIAFADSLADSCGVYFSEEARGTSFSECLVSSSSTLVGKLLFALSFLVPIIFFDLHPAIIIDIVYGLLVLGIYGFFVAKSKNASVFKTISFHLVLVLIVIAISHLVGTYINSIFT